MAYSTTITCTKCLKLKTIIVSSGDFTTVCGECKAAEEQEKRDKYFAELDKLTLEERVRRIEEWIYDYQPQYVPPPRY